MTSVSNLFHFPFEIWNLPFSNVEWKMKSAVKLLPHCSNVILGFHPCERGLAYDNLLRPGPAAVFADIIGLTGLFVHAGLFQIKRDVNSDRRAFQTFKVCACAFGLGHISSSGNRQ